MAGLITIVSLAIIGMFICIIFFPKAKIGKVSFSTFYLAPLLGAICLLVFQIIDPAALWSKMTASSTINPIYILILFFSMTLISILLDEAGFFHYLAEKTASKNYLNQNGLFLSFYLLISILTVFTSNDIIILTFTPFIISFCLKSRIDPRPYLVSEFVAANTWSIILIIGNPTNIYLASSFNISFFSYFNVMWLPAILAGTVSFLIMRIMFAKSLKVQVSGIIKYSDKPLNLKLVLPPLLVLIICIALMAASSFFDFSMWMVSLICGGVILIYYVVYSFISKDAKGILLRAIKRLPYELIPFVLSMFILSYGLETYGIAGQLASLLKDADPIFRYGLTSFLACNIVNNIPMSVFYTSVIASAVDTIKVQAIYASIIGSNIGAFLSPIGALAGIMWMSIIKNYGYDYSFGKFTRDGVIISIPTILASLAGLLVTL